MLISISNIFWTPVYYQKPNTTIQKIYCFSERLFDWGFEKSFIENLDTDQVSVPAFNADRKEPFILHLPRLGLTSTIALGIIFKAYQANTRFFALKILFYLATSIFSIGLMIKTVFRYTHSFFYWKPLDTKNDLSPCLFFHATTKEGLEGILKSQEVAPRANARHGIQNIQAAFVSTVPENDFGDFFLVFNCAIQNIPIATGEMLQFVNPYTNQKFQKYWAGFSQSIPVNKSTLAFIGGVTDKPSEVCSMIPPQFRNIPMIHIPKSSIDAFAGTRLIQEKFVKQGFVNLLPAHWPNK